MTWNASIAYGADWDGEDCRIVRATRRGRRIEYAVVRKPGMDASDLTGIWLRIRNDQQSGRALLASAIPASGTGVFPLSSPFTSVAKARRIWRSLLDLQLPFPVEDSVFNLMEVGPDTTGRVAARAVIARREIVQECLSRWAEQGLDPDRLDAEGPAVWSQSLEEIPPAQQNAWRVVSFVTPTHSVFAVGCGSRFVNAFSIQGEFPGAEDTAPARMARVMRTLRAAGVPADEKTEWHGAGCGVNWATVQARIEKDLGEFVWKNPREPELFLARALARRALRPDAWPCSFRQGDLTAPAQRLRDRRRMRRAAWINLAAGLLLIAGNRYAGWRMTREESRMSEQLTAAARRVSGAARIPKEFEYRTARQTYELKLRDRAPIERAFQSSLLARLRALADAAREDGLRIERLELDTDKIELAGNVSGQNGLPQSLEVLKSLGYRIEEKSIPEDGGPIRIRARGAE